MGAGTYLYASPEQLSEHRCYDNKTDIYSLGILLFEMLCPFSTGMERVKTLMDIRQGKFSDKFIKTWPREVSIFYFFFFIFFLFFYLLY